MEYISWELPIRNILFWLARHNISHYSKSSVISMPFFLLNGPRSVADFFFSLVFMVGLTIVRWGYKPTYNALGPHIAWLSAGADMFGGHSPTAVGG